jgi:hypothetical protein
MGMNINHGQYYFLLAPQEIAAGLGNYPWRWLGQTAQPLDILHPQGCGSTAGCPSQEVKKRFPGNFVKVNYHDLLNNNFKKYSSSSGSSGNLGGGILILD